MRDTALKIGFGFTLAMLCASAPQLANVALLAPQQAGDVSVTLTMTQAQAARVNAALAAKFVNPDDPGETAINRYKRWLRTVHIELVFRYEREEAVKNIAPDLGVGVQ